MGVKVDFEVQHFQAVRFIGKEVIVGKNNPVPELWNQILNDGTNDQLQSLPERVSPKGDTIGWMGEYNPQTKEFVYIAGIFAKPNAAVPGGFSYRDIHSFEKYATIQEDGNSTFTFGYYLPCKRIV